MDLNGIYLVSENLNPATTAMVTDAEARLGAPFPSGYKEYVTKLGAGVLSGYVCIWTPDRILAEHAEYRELWGNNFLWEEGEQAIAYDRVLESIILGDTWDGDSIVFHPRNPSRIYVLPREVNRTFEIGANLSEALVWLCDSGELTDPIEFKYFETFNNRKKLKYIAPKEGPFPVLQERLLNLKIHDRSEVNMEEEYLKLFVKDFFGTVSVFGRPKEFLVFIEHDADKRTGNLTLLQKQLEGWGFVLETGSNP
jgi:hypothetical protein